MSRVGDGHEVTQVLELEFRHVLPIYGVYRDYQLNRLD